MKNSFIVSILILSILLACSPAKKQAGRNSVQSYNKLFIFANTIDIEFRVLFETDLDASVKSNGYNSIKSLSVMPRALDDTTAPAKQQLMEKLKAADCDGLIVVQLVNKPGVKYVPGTNFKGTTPFISGLVSGVLGYSNPGTSNYEKNIYKPGSFQQEKGAYMVVNLLDGATEVPVYSESSDMFDINKLNEFSKVYMAGLVKRLKEKKLLAK